MKDVLLAQGLVLPNPTLTQVETNASRSVPTTPDEAAESILGSIGQIWAAFLEQLPLIGAGILILLLTWAAAAVFKRTGERFLPRKRLRASLRELLLRLAMIAIWVGGIFLAMTVVFPDITPGRALATLGLGSIAIGFAFKDIFENFFAGVLILWRFPFDPGDYIECEGIMGQVQDVTIRNTLIRKTTGELVVIPNATIFKSPVHVLTNLNRRRVTVICGVAYDEDVDESRRVITEAVAACKTVLKDQPIQIFAQEFAENSINFEVTWWTGPLPVDTRRSKDEVVAAVKRALDNAGIEIPFPYRTLTFKGPVETRTIEEHDGRCPRTEPACARFLKEAALAFASGSSISGRVETAVTRNAGIGPARFRREFCRPNEVPGWC